VQKPQKEQERISEECFTFFEELPSELRQKIIATILEDNVNRWDDIFKFDRNSLKEVLDQITLISKDFVVFKKKEFKEFIRNLKQKRSAYLEEIIKDDYKNLSREELNGTLTNLLIFNVNQKDLELSVKLIIAGGDIDTKKDDGRTALISAAFQGHREIVRL